MKQLKLFFLLLLPFFALGQVSTGQEQQFDYGIQNLAPQTIVSPDWLTTTGADGTQGKMNTANLISPDRLTAANMSRSTGLYSFASGGITAASSTTFNVGAVGGFIQSSASPGTTAPIAVAYPGGTGLTTPHLLTAPATYVLVKPDNTLLLQPTAPTVTEKRNNIYLGVIGHPAGTITGIGNSPDICLNEMSQVRAMFEPTRLINDGVFAYANSTNLTLANTAGTLYGFGIGFTTNGNDAPSILNIAAGAPMTTQYRTQGTTTFANTTVADPGFYDLAGTRTAIPGSGNQATNQRFYLLENGMIRIQYGQTIYANLTDAIAAASNESFVVNVNAKKLGILIGILSIEKGCTNLSLTADARFLPVSKFGETVGAAAGIAIGTLQTSYNNSIEPEIITNSTLGALTVRRGSAADTDSVLVGQNGAGTNTFSVDGNGKLSASSYLFTPTSTTGTAVIRNGQGADTATIQEWKNIAGTTTASITGAGVLSTTPDVLINGLTVGKGGGSVVSNTAMGTNALFTNTSSINCSAFGNNVLRFNTGNSNSGFGSGALGLLGNGTNNAAFGTNALSDIVLQTRNSAFGGSAFQGLTSGSDNVGFGTDAGRFLANGSTVNTNSTDCTFIGSATKSFSAAQTNQIVIGQNAIGAGSHSVVLGNDLITKTALKGRVIQGQTGTIVDNGVDAMQTTGSTTQTGQFKSTLATGTAPFSVASTTLNANLNADLLDGSNSTDFVAITGNQSITGTKTFSTNSSASVIVATSTSTGSIITANGQTGATGYNYLGQNNGSTTFYVDKLGDTGVNTIKTNGYTVGTLPAGVIGMRTYVTDALAPTYLGVAVGGGAIVAPVFYNGTNWVTN